MTKVPKLTSGRKRIWADSAERQRAYRRRKADKTEPVTSSVTKSETFIYVAYTAIESTVHGVFSSVEAAKQALEVERLRRNEQAKREVEWAETSGNAKGEYYLAYSSKPIWIKRFTLE